MRHQTFTTFTLLLLAGAGSGDHAANPVRPAAGPKRTCTAGTFRHLGSPKLAYAGIVKSRATVFARPGSRVFARCGRRNQNGVPTIFSIRGVRVDRSCRHVSYLVQIPRRPNGVAGWVPAAQVTVERVHTRIVVDLSQKQVTLYRGGRRMLTATAAVRPAATPTPTGSFFG